jgi:uncharacterized phage infection (PIP) family protein YhgE
LASSGSLTGAMWILDMPKNMLGFPFRLLALASLSLLGLGASQAGALTPVQADPAATPLPVEGAPPGSGPRSTQDQEAPLVGLKEVLEATRAKLDELTEAVTANSKLRDALEALKKDNQRLTDELAQASSRQSELESARARIAELTKAAEAARGQSARLEAVLTRLRRQNAQLDQSVSRAHAARESAEAKAERTQVEMTKKLEEAVNAAARSKAELAAVQEQLGQAAGAAVEAERARQTATREADALRNETARARRDLTAARAEIDGLKIANAEFEKQVASRRLDLTSATDMARQNLIMIAEKIAALNAALDTAHSDETAPPRRPHTAAEPAEHAPATTTPATSAVPQPPAPPPASSTDGNRPADDASKVETAGPAPALAEAESGLERFRAHVEALNDVELRSTGSNLFSGVEAVNGNKVDVGTTAAWESLPPVGQEGYLESLLDDWVAVQGGKGPAVVRIVDQSGRVVLEKSTP